MLEMVSFGGGVNSVAMVILLVERGFEGAIVFLDTGAEKPDTYCYLDYFAQEFLAPRGLVITRLAPGSRYHSAMSAVPLEEYCLREGVVPLGGVRWCSGRWKGRPLDKWAKAHRVERRYMGIAFDEAHRARGKPAIMGFPLIEERITRAGCWRVISQAGLRAPLWSSCFFCPGQTYGEWRYVHDHYPDLWKRARELEQNARRRKGVDVTINSHMSLEEMEGRGWGVQLGFDLSDMMPCLCRSS